MNLLDVILIVLIAAAVIAAVIRIIKDRRQGRVCSGCGGGDCAYCRSVNKKGGYQ